MTRAWPQIVSLSLGMFPVLALAGIGTIVLMRGLPALSSLGLSELFSNEFSSQFGSGGFKFGLLPAIWGTVLVTVLALAIAVPVSLCLALISTEFPLGIVSKGVRMALGVLGGIPSIVYGLTAAIFVTAIMIPKFAADASGPYEIPAQFAGTPQASLALPWAHTTDPNSTILGAFLIALLLIPFIAPMIEDAIRSVPAAQKEASLALGMTRWTTQRRIIIPYASPGLISAISLGALKAMGDIMIAIFVIGFESPRVNDPLFDVFQREPPLSAVGANLLGGIGQQGSCENVLGGSSVQALAGSENRCDAAYFSALMLMVVALVVLSIAYYLQSRFRKKYAR